MSSRQDQEEIQEINRMLKYDNVGHFTSIHSSKMSLLEPQFEAEGTFTDKTF